jgi:hypothetical protein
MDVKIHTPTAGYEKHAACEVTSFVILFQTQKNNKNQNLQFIERSSKCGKRLVMKKLQSFHTLKKLHLLHKAAALVVRRYISNNFSFVRMSNPLILRKMAKNNIFYNNPRAPVLMKIQFLRSTVGDVSCDIQINLINSPE